MNHLRIIYIQKSSILIWIDGLKCCLY